MNNYKNFLTNVEPGEILRVLYPSPLYPQKMWSQQNDNDTWIFATSKLEIDDQVIVLDVMNGNLDYAFAALVATYFGIGCVLLLNTHFKKIKDST